MQSLMQMKNILDGISGVGIYVILQDDHKMLYFNQRVKEVAPEVELGMQCHKLWEGTCDNCPLLGMEGKQSNTCINYNDPFGEIVDLSATRMMWEDIIPAFIITASPHVMTVSEQEIELERRKMTLAIAGVYPMVISVNLT